MAAWCWCCATCETTVRSDRTDASRNTLATGPGVLVIPDAGLKLKPGQVVEVERLTKQIQAALKNGRLAMADKPKQEPLAPPEPDQDAEPVDLSKLSATDAISKVNEEANPETLKGYMETEKRRTVIDALKSRLEGLQGAAE